MPCTTLRPSEDGAAARSQGYWSLAYSTERAAHQAPHERF
jgi:hypothetical protein